VAPATVESPEDFPAVCTAAMDLVTLEFHNNLLLSLGFLILWVLIF
jgi:hypothetical protein